jgi:outer membrane protein OmpA-like peptidoglycan-associated protein
MKYIDSSLKLLLVVTVICFSSTQVQGQFLKKLGKRAEKAAERAVERRVEKETTEKTDQVLDSILEPGSKGGNKAPVPKEDSPVETGSGGNSTSGGTDEPNASTPGQESIEVYSKFDFVPGDKLLFFDDFTNDFVGDFPSKWNTNGGGELVAINDSPSKWLKILPGFGTEYIPDLEELPEEFTMEFDVIIKGLDNKTSSQAFLQIMVGDTKTFEKPKNYGFVEYPLCQFIDPGIIVENNINGKREIRNDIRMDIRKTVTSGHHISLAVNKQRFRIWMNEQKLVDVPRLLPANIKMKGIKIHLRGIDINKESVYLSNFKIAEGGEDLRRKLLADGKISTNGILFNSGAADIQPQSMGIIRQIYQVLQQDTSLSLKIVGHTDSDGEEASNLALSKSRAVAVKNALVDIYGVDIDRLSTDGKGESQPVGDNNTIDGKSQNRRVEFIKQ